jgi:uncharacterized alpha-E superfamily protein
MALLSRVATVLYVLGRDVERTEHLARLLRVHFELSLDRPASAGGRSWSDFLQLAGWPAPEPVVREHAVGLVLSDETGPSLRRTMESARRAAQSVRPSLSIEVWEQVNSLYWRLSETDAQGEMYGYLHELEMGTQLIAGLVDDTMAHDEAWSFVKLGKHVERAASVTRLVAHKSLELAERQEDPIAWASVLRCCASLEAFRLRFGATMAPETVALFLLLDRLSPRSARFCVGEALAAVRAIDASERASDAHRVLGRLFATYEYADPAAVGASPGAFAGRVGQHVIELYRALRQGYFQPSTIVREMEDDGLAHHPQQQQQQRQQQAPG